MAHFDHAHDFRIENLVYNIGSNSKSALERLEGCITPGAIHNSDERSDAPLCMPETRVAVQNDILSWIESDVEDKKMMWLSGPAGAGKTAIAGTVAETCNQRGTLAASFFFSSFSPSVDRSSKRGLVATLAYQLRQRPGMASAGEGMLAAIDKDPVILRQRLSDQLEALILRPIRQFGVGGAEDPLATSARPKVIIVDGLDECVSDRSLPEDPEKKAKIVLETQRDQLEVLNALLAAADERSFPFKILVVSRPERIITEFFSNSAHSRTLPLFLDNKYDPDSDIRLFLTARFADIRRRYHIPASWPTNEDVEQLVRRASGQFIYVATVIRFIQGRSSSPQSQLDSIMNLNSTDHNIQAFADLDALYTHILMLTPNPLLSGAWSLLVTSACADWTRPSASKALPALFCRQFLETVPGETEHLLGDLGSLVRIPPREDKESPYTLFHASLHDFLSDQNRCPSLISANIRSTLYSIYVKAFRRVLIHQGPRQPLEPEQLEEFLDKFLTLFPAAHGSLITNCDVVWWTNIILCHPHSREIVALYLFGAHGPYSTAWNDGRFRPRKAFKLWTRSIINECRKRGWKTPSRVEIFWRDITRAFLGRHWFHGDILEKFVPPAAGRRDTKAIGLAEK